MAEPKTREQVVAISNAVADQWKIPRLLLLACGIAESNLRWDSRRPASPTDDERFWPDVSGGVWQQTVRYDPEYTGGGGYPGPGEIARILSKQYDVDRSAHVAAANLKQKLGLERSDPLTDATDDQILRALYRFNWPGGAGKPYTAAHEENYRRGMAEAKKILGGSSVPTALPYNPDARVDVQPDDFSCSIQSTEFLLRSIGRDPSDAWIAAQLVPSIVSTDVGLKDGSGRQLAAWITREYGQEMGFVAQASPVTFDDVAAGAGVNPTIVGGHGWGSAGHWAGIRRLLPDGTLELANPAPNYTGVGASLSRAEWDARGPWDAIWIDRASTLPASPPTPKPVPQPVPQSVDRAAVAAKIRAIMALMDAQNAAIRAEWQALLRMVEGSSA